MKRIWIYLAFSFGITWAMAFALMAKGGLQNPLASFVFMLFMLVPAASNVLTRLVTRQGWSRMMLKPNFRRGWRSYLWAWLLTPALIFAGAALYFLIFPGQFDPSMSAVLAAAKQQISAVGGAAALPETSLRLLLLAQLVGGIFISPVVNIVFTTGEELGWRGYLLPGLMERFSPRTATVLTGVIWGLWHAPMIAMGHNYGLNYPGAPWWGILAMVVFTVFVGTFFAWVTIRSGSMFPAAVGHGALNGMAGAAAYFLVAGQGNPFVGPLPTGIIGGFGFVVMGVICFFLLKKPAAQPLQTEAAAEALAAEATGTDGQP